MGAGITSDAFHMVALPDGQRAVVDEEGDGNRTGALDIDHINAHGTTGSVTPAEAAAIRVCWMRERPRSTHRSQPRPSIGTVGAPRPVLTVLSAARRRHPADAQLSQDPIRERSELDVVAGEPATGD